MAKASSRSHSATMVGLLRENSRRHRLHKVFSDFCEVAALAVSNSVDLRQYEAREARYMKIVGEYEREEVFRFRELVQVLVDWMGLGLNDCLGELYMSLELGNTHRGQYFTPLDISRLMARLTQVGATDAVAKNGFVLINEPTCGSGGMILAAADELQLQGLNYQQTMHATAIDVDLTAVHMAYVQLSLAHIPAVVVHGNTLTMSTQSQWFTPAHLLGGWDRRMRDKQRREDRPEVQNPPGLGAVTIDENEPPEPHAIPDPIGTDSFSCETP